MPKLNLKEHITSKQKKQSYVNQMFVKIAPFYDSFTVFFSFGMDRGWKRKLLEMVGLKGDESVLDLACGTGDITFMLARQLPKGSAVGLDIVPEMIALAEKKRISQGVTNCRFECADIMKMPFPDQSFDRVTCGYALRNVPDVEEALREIHRVLKPGGTFHSLEFGHPSNRLYRWLYLHYLIVTGSIAGILLHGDADVYRYIPESLKLYPGQQRVAEMMARQGFEKTGFEEFGGGIMAINYGTRSAG